MEQFNPEISIVAVDDHDVIVTFDSAAPHDHARAVRARHIHTLASPVFWLPAVGKLLKQMGLDPGKAGDTGCFAPQ